MGQKSDLDSLKYEVESCMRKLEGQDLKDIVAGVQDQKNRHLSGTCAWVNETTQYKEWHSHESHSILWIHGSPGKGKTMLAVSQIETFRDRLPSEEMDDTILAGFFCNDRVQKKRDATYILRNFLYQILDRHPILFDTFRDKYNRQETEILFSTVTSLWGILESVLEELTVPILFVIDALDECEQETREILLDKILDRFGDSTGSTGKSMGQYPRVKWLFTSRYELPIRDILVGKVLEVSLEEHDKEVSRDVRLFIEAGVSSLYAAKKPPIKKQEEIKQIIYQKAGGTFLWVSLALRELRNKTWLHATKTLETLPKELNELYEKFLTTALDGEFADLAKNILVAVLLALRPLTFFELAAIAAFPEEYADDFDTISVILEECSSFLAIRNSTVSLIHQSVKEYLVTSHLLKLSPELEREHGLIMINSFNYIISGVFDQRSFDISAVYSYDVCFIPPGWEGETGIDESHDHSIKPDIISYPVIYWVQHAKYAGPYMGEHLEPLLELSHDFFRPVSNLFENWLETWGSHGSTQGATFIISEGATPMHLAALCGISSLVDLFQEWSLFSVDTPTNSGDTPLILACMRDEVSTASRLLWHGANVDTQNLTESYPLEIATRHRNKSLVKLLLESGASVTVVKRFEEKKLLHMAAQSGEVEIARLLLQHGVDVNPRARDMYTPLHFAVEVKRDNTEMVRLLLEKGADSHVTTYEDGSTPLHIAAERGYNTYINLLLDGGADINQVQQDINPEFAPRTALLCAAIRRHESTVHLLLERGAKIAVDTDYKLHHIYSSWSETNPALFKFFEQRVAELRENDATRETGLYIEHYDYASAFLASQEKKVEELNHADREALFGKRMLL